MNKVGIAQVPALSPDLADYSADRTYGYYTRPLKISIYDAPARDDPLHYGGSAVAMSTGPLEIVALCFAPR